MYVLEFFMIVPAALLGLWISRTIQRRAVILAMAAMAAIVFNLIAAMLPFAGFRTEALIPIVGAISLAPGLGYIFHLGERRTALSSANSNTQARQALIMPLLLFLIVAVVVPWIERARYASDLGWSCDGTIVELYHSSNHQAPSVRVREDDGQIVRWEGVSPNLFDQAHVGDHLKKADGEPIGFLNGREVRIVPARLGN